MNYDCIYESPIGLLHLVSNGSELIGVHFSDQRRPAPPGGDPTIDPFPEAVEQLDKYFAGTLQRFDLPIVLHGTRFQIRAWNELTRIPFGETISYKAQAEKIGSVARAVGLANGQNPVPVIVPCHRVIGADGSLVGYGGGIVRKRALLQFEATVRDFGPHHFPVLREHGTDALPRGRGHTHNLETEVQS